MSDLQLLIQMLNKTNEQFQKTKNPIGEWSVILTEKKIRFDFSKDGSLEYIFNKETK